LSFFGGISGASRNGILIKGGNYLEALNNIDVVAFDKTGTLTKGVFNVTEIRPADGFSQEQLLEAAAQAEAYSNHPIAHSILREYGKTVDKKTLSNYIESAGLGVSVKANGRGLVVGNGKLMKEKGIAYIESLKSGTKVYVAADEVFMGSLVISDEVKPESHSAINELKGLGIKKTIMLTGDVEDIAEELAAKLEINEVFSELLPQGKVDIMQQLIDQKTNKGKLVFVGDGINDAPVLAMADVGVAMGALGSDAALEAADVVLMTDELTKLPQAVRIARITKRIVWQNIIFALTVKALFLFLGSIGVASMWEAVFADVGVSLLAIFNAMRAMRAR
jgi:Cd2+/Zn2+-exporting ATPase